MQIKIKDVKNNLIKTLLLKIKSDGNMNKLGRVISLNISFSKIKIIYCSFFWFGSCIKNNNLLKEISLKKYWKILTK